MALVSLGRAAADAQTTQPQRPNGELFGTRRVNPRSRQAMDLNVALLGVYDDNRVDGSQMLQPDPAQETATYSVLQAGLRYTRGKRTVFGLNAGSSLRYYQDPRAVVMVSHSVGGVFGSRLWSSSTFKMNQTASYTPFYLFALVPSLSEALFDEQIQTTAFDHGVQRWEAYTFRTGLDLTQAVGPRISLSVGYARQDVQFLSRGSDGDLFTDGAHARLSYRVTRHAGFHAGYGSRAARYGLSAGSELPSGSELTRAHDLDVGLDYSRPLSISRRTTLSFGTGSSIIPGPDKTYYYRVTGEANLKHEIGRTWTAGFAFRRGVQFIEGFREPILSDSATLGAGGQLGWRANLSTSVGYSTGEVGVATSAAGFDTYSGSTQLRVSVTRYLALYAEYAYYQYRFGGAVALPEGLARALGRHTARAGLKLWVPLLD